jgi:hypothetical protein
MSGIASCTGGRVVMNSVVHDQLTDKRRGGARGGARAGPARRERSRSPGAQLRRGIGAWAWRRGAGHTCRCGRRRTGRGTRPTQGVASPRGPRPGRVQRSRAAAPSAAPAPRCTARGDVPGDWLGRARVALWSRPRALSSLARPQRVSNSAPSARLGPAAGCGCGRGGACWRKASSLSLLHSRQMSSVTLKRARGTSK